MNETEATQDNHSITLSPEFQEYLRLVSITATRLGRRFEGRGGNDRAEEISQMVVLQFLRDPQSIMARYQAEVFAAVAIRNRHEDWRRSERIQRGQGAREVTGADGLRRAARDVGSLEALTDTIGDLTRGGGDIADSVVTNVDVRAALLMLDIRKRSLVWFVDVEGYTVGEIAACLGLSRPYAQRLLGAARDFIRDYVTAA